MARGRKPDAPDVQAAKGNPGKRPVRKPATPVKAGAVSPPKWLKKSRQASVIWNALAPLLERINALTALDAFPLARYCRYCVDWIAADEAVRKEGVWYDTTDTNGAATKKRHPAFHARQDLDKTLREIEAAFGMRPDARYKLMRDQALAAGGLPLFGGQASDVPPSGEAAAQADEAEESRDLVGMLTGLDSAGPDLSRPH